MGTIIVNILIKTRNRNKSNKYESTDEELEFEDEMIRKVKRTCRRQEFIVVREDHVVHKRSEPGQTDVWIRNKDLQEIWEGFQPITTEEEKTRKMLKILQKEERKNRKQWKKNKQALDALMGRGV